MTDGEKAIFTVSLAAICDQMEAELRDRRRLGTEQLGELEAMYAAPAAIPIKWWHRRAA